MRVIIETDDRTITTPAAVMTGLAAPSQGSAELSTWRVRMNPDSESPVHVIDLEQVWMPSSGTFEFVVDGETVKAGSGEVIIIPGGSARQFRTSGETAVAIVCMPAGGQVGMPGDDVFQPIPWAL